MGSFTSKDHDVALNHNQGIEFMFDNESFPILVWIPVVILVAVILRFVSRRQALWGEEFRNALEQRGVTPTIQTVTRCKTHIKIVGLSYASGKPKLTEKHFDAIGEIVKHDFTPWIGMSQEQALMLLNEPHSITRLEDTSGVVVWLGWGMKNHLRGPHLRIKFLDDISVEIKQGL